MGKSVRHIRRDSKEFLRHIQEPGWKLYSWKISDYVPASQDQMMRLLDSGRIEKCYESKERIIIRTDGPEWYELDGFRRDQVIREKKSWTKKSSLLT